MIAHVLAMLEAAAGPSTPPSSDIVDPSVVAPPGATQLGDLPGMVKWVASRALIVGFFAGLAVFTGGRLADHHRAGRIGLIMILVSLVGGLLYLVGPQVISSFAGQ